ncbi:dihydrolipoamide acetyltransferase family protein [Rhodococcus sp. SGAir0479]|uniref:dihydrolipoamide acetyltransferase family protein n=1 Tax=Rhodococcus sp. SGAir0479 TaxID=2567884 RepID=UPI0010CCCA7D|nr:dihydrolipoamide acetyltransferase family protein [Rhodococcus sp. SGAir0479]QCQ90525.1 2-oxo acid dehydrogenase subunit E2 [Rhodococcus sp. SGAir0479]
MSIEEFRLPDLGEGLTEAEIVAWAVAAGDTVALNQVIAEVETAKALVELPSPFAGVVREVLAEPGDTVPVGAPLIRIASAAADERTAEPSGGPSDGPARTAVLVGYGPSDPVPSRRRRPAAAHPPGPGVDAVPAARRAARELGLDLAAVVGTGPGGAVTVDDVHRARLQTTPTPATPAASGAARETRTPIRGVRRETASAMVASAFTAPHVTEFLTVDVTGTVELLARLRTAPPFADLHPTPLVLVAGAMLAVLRAHPSLNASWSEETGEIVTKHYVDLGIATATARGLVVPHVRDAETLTLPALCRAIGELTDRARAGRATPADLTGGTITVTNVGVYGVDTGTPILNPGEAAIVALGAINRRPWVVDDELAVRDVTTLSVTVDHRLVDGEQASNFLADLGAALTDPVPVLLGRL